MNKYTLCAFADEAADGIEGQIEALGAIGARLLEIRAVDGVNIADMTDCAADEISQRLRAAGISVWALGSPLGKSDISEPREYECARLRRLAQLARIFGTRRIRMFSYYIPEGEHDKYRAEVIERLRMLVSIADEHDVVLCHENEKGIFGDTPERCGLLLDAVPGLRAVFDPANFAQCGCDALDAYRLLEGRVDYMHIKDCAADGRIVPPGEGVCSLGEIIARYSGDGGEVFTLEPHLCEFTGLAGLEKSGRTVTGGYTQRMEAFCLAGRALSELLEGGGRR